jgi:hypothetical protein
MLSVMILDRTGNKIETVQMPSVPRVGEGIKVVGASQYKRPFRVTRVEYEFQGSVENLRYMWVYVTVEEC